MLELELSHLFSLHKLHDKEMISNHASLLDLVHAESIDIILLTEIWLTDRHFNKEIISADYNIFRADRKLKIGGGVLIAIKDCSFADVKQVAIDQYPDLEIVCVECTTCKDIRTLIVCCYIPPNCLKNGLSLLKNSWIGLIVYTTK